MESHVPSGLWRYWKSARGSGEGDVIWKRLNDAGDRLLYSRVPNRGGDCGPFGSGFQGRDERFDTLARYGGPKQTIRGQFYGSVRNSGWRVAIRVTCTLSSPTCPWPLRQPWSATACYSDRQRRHRPAPSCDRSRNRGRRRLICRLKGRGAGA